MTCWMDYLRSQEAGSQAPFFIPLLQSFVSPWAFTAIPAAKNCAACLGESDCFNLLTPWTVILRTGKKNNDSLFIQL